MHVDCTAPSEYARGYCAKSVKKNSSFVKRYACCLLALCYTLRPGFLNVKACNFSRHVFVASRILLFKCEIQEEVTKSEG